MSVLRRWRARRDLSSSPVSPVVPVVVDDSCGAADEELVASAVRAVSVLGARGSLVRVEVVRELGSMTLVASSGGRVVLAVDDVEAACQLAAMVSLEDCEFSAVQAGGRVFVEGWSVSWRMLVSGVAALAGVSAAF